MLELKLLRHVLVYLTLSMKVDIEKSWISNILLFLNYIQIFQTHVYKVSESYLFESWLMDIIASDLYFYLTFYAVRLIDGINLQTLTTRLLS